MLTVMTPQNSTARFEELLSTRARIGWGGSVTTARPVSKPLYEFGGGYPDPASFPYDGMVEATAKMIKAEGADALTYGDPQGYRGRASGSASRRYRSRPRANRRRRGFAQTRRP